MRFIQCLATILICGLLSACGDPKTESALTVVTGPTPIPRGDAQGQNDITVNNGLFVVSFAVETAPPWGVARGGIVDIALLRDGKPGYDIASLADFMPNNWSSWPTTYQRVSIAEQSPAHVVVKSERDWGDAQLVTTFTIRGNDSRIAMKTTMTNASDENTEKILSGYVVWPDGGYLFGVPGLSGLVSSVEDEALADWTAAYDENWAMGLHAPFAEFVSYSGRDRYLPHTLGPGESRTFDAVLQIEARGDLSPFVAEEARVNGHTLGTIAGEVSSNGVAVENPAIIATVDGKPYAWTIGNEGKFSFELPPNYYELYATAAGYSASSPAAVSLAADAELVVDFKDLNPPGVINMQVSNAGTGESLDARITIKTGQQSLIEYFGKSTFFTELSETGKATLTIAPGDYEFEVSAGGGFSSVKRLLPLTVTPGGTHNVSAEVAVVAIPSEFGWYSADLHHHSDVLDGFTKPEYVMRSELASGVDIIFLSDHDSMANNPEMQRLSDEAGKPFIPAAEISPSWAHFNAYPIDPDKTIEIDVGASPVQEIFAEARRLGADIIHANHPYGDYGYFGSLDAEEVPGGYSDDFDAIEITAGDNSKTLTRAWELWNQGKRAYLVGGSDVHDVWNEVSGDSRTYAFVRGELGADAFIAAVKAGRAYASQGPIVYPGLMFGNDFQHKLGDTLTVAFTAIAANGLREAQLISNGELIDTMTYDGEESLVQRQFEVSPEESAWFSLLIEDQNGKLAYTNPIWVTVQP